jgi:hypothetical protein
LTNSVMRIIGPSAFENDFARFRFR